MPIPAVDPEDVAPLNTKSRPYTLPSYKWLELGHEDPMVKVGRWRMLYYGIKERDPLYYDPPVTDSRMGATGMEGGRSLELTWRAMPGHISHEEWRDRRYFLDPNVRAIYEKYPITRQHPGLLFRPSGIEEYMEDKNFMSGVFPSLGYIREWPGIMPQNWRFNAAPIGEQCHVKTAVCCKYGLFAGTMYFVHLAIGGNLGAGWRKLFKLWLDKNKLTVPVAASWAASSCLVGSVRGKDDVWNMYAGGVGVGVIVGHQMGFFRGFYATLLSTVLGLSWYYLMAFEHGYSYTGATTQQKNMVPWDPAHYKWTVWEGKMSELKAKNW